MVAGQSDIPLVLIVDEVPSLVRLIQLELGFQGFRTSTAMLDEKVAEAAEALRPDAIVLGSSIPFPGVYDVLVQLKRSGAAPVLFVYGLGNSNDGSLAMDMGADDILAAPYLPEELGMHL